MLSPNIPSIILTVLYRYPRIDPGSDNRPHNRRAGAARFGPPVLNGCGSGLFLEGKDYANQHDLQRMRQLCGN